MSRGYKLSRARRNTLIPDMFETYRHNLIRVQELVFSMEQVVEFLYFVLYKVVIL